jgi:hypothetical protein
LLLVFRICIRIDEAHGNCGAALPIELRDRVAHTFEIKRKARLARGHHPLANAEPPPSRYKRIGFLGEEIPDVAPFLTLKLQHVAEALGSDQSDLGTLPFENRVRCHCRAVDKSVDCGEIVLQLLHSFHGADRLI